MNGDRSIYFQSIYHSAQNITGSYQYCHQTVMLFTYVGTREADSVYRAQDAVGIYCTGMHATRKRLFSKMVYSNFIPFVREMSLRYH